MLFSFTLSFVLFYFFATDNNVESLNDNTLYQINWPGSLKIDINKFAPPGIEYKDDDSFIITSSDSEQYQCSVPSLSQKDSFVTNEEAAAKSVTELLASVLKLKSCSYFVESYWTYELCHGKHIRQYHEENTRRASSSSTTYLVKNENGKIVIQPDDKADSVKTTEYYLGNMKEKVDNNGYLKENAILSADQVSKKKINGVKTPYFAINMTDGTPCDLSGVPRKSTVLYICGESNQSPPATLLSVTETSSCEYELIVATSELCKHPFYKIHGQEVNQIQCVPLDHAPAKPAALTSFLQQQPHSSSHSQQRVHSRSVEERSVDEQKVGTSTISPLVDQSLLRDFLSGSYCLNGGTGWWRFEYCYGMYVQQYHDDKTTGRTSIIIGNWDEDVHLEWASKTSSVPVIYKTDESGVKSVSQVAHFYGNGDICDETGTARQVVVRMKCKKDGASPHAVAIYLLEPRTCSYILGVESPIFCDLLHSADQNGLLTLQ